ncbi:MAG TPA: transglutaminaseTgpA domain-containing protein [Candidatus Sulfotelmatobacter sp.]|nr:transglutaminaseTgpA domain-containing protein [Candidatus Sulfotelmatobacter sp.]
MSPPSSQSGLPPLTRAIDYYFELALYLLVLTGFATLASTGGLDLPSTILVGVALAIRGYLLSQRRQFVISERWTTPLSVAYFIFFAADYFIFSHSFLPATIHLALFGVVVRMFSLRRERDHVTLAILAFLMVLASAVLTVDSIFLFSFAVFMMMAVGTFVLMEMRGSGHAANIQARHSNDPKEHRHLAFALARVAPALMLMILLSGTAVFFLMPRMSAGYMGAYSFGTNISSGFSDHVQLGQIGQIQQSSALVMHIEIDGDRVGGSDLHWRGVALADFDGHTWSNPREQFILQRQPDNSFRVPPANAELRSSVTPYVTQNLARRHMIHYRVLMEPIGTNVFFLAPWARDVSGNYRMLAADSSGAVYNFDTSRAISRYEADSDIATAAPAELRAAGQNYPTQVTATYLRLPEIDPRVPRLAAQITNSASNDFDRATALENYLRTRFGYTLELPQTAVKDPIANFLFERKRGHCEYFASSMAVMLRTLGIPSRVVTGFRSDEFNDLTGKYVVRAKDAHAWVEAYFPGSGWQTFDPTPAGASGTPEGWSRLALYVDAISSFWRDWVVSYDTSHQYALGQAAFSGSRGLWTGARTWARNKYASMLKWARRSQDRVEHSPGRWAVLGAAVTLVLLLLGNLGRIARLLHEKWLAAHPERSPEQAAAMWYRRMARALARRGVEKPAAQTPQEFAKKIEDSRLREPVARFTQVYESARFGNSIDDAQRLPELYEEVEMATRAR